MRLFSCLHFLAFVVFSIHCCIARPPQEYTYLNHTCSGDHYAPNSIYQKNLNTLLSTLLSDEYTNYGFYNFSEGGGNDRVNVIALCRGDVTRNVCHTCLKFSMTDLLRMCATQQEAIVWYDLCSLRYSNKLIFNTWENPDFFMWNEEHVFELEVNWFSFALGGLLSKLRDQASLGDSRVKYASGDTSFGQSRWIYGLVQCTPDLTELQCSDCLQTTFRESTYLRHGILGGRAVGPSCNFRYELSQLYQIPPPPSFLAPPPPVQSLPIDGNVTQRGNQKVIFIVTSMLGFVALVIGMCMFARLYRRKPEFRSNEQHEHILLPTDAHDTTFTESLRFDFKTLHVATDGFKKENKLGQGGFGSVYKGKLIEGKEIAVKRLAAHSGQGDSEFMNEVVLLAKLQHRNLVRLLGYCLEGNERLLIYEYVPNSSLDNFLFDPLGRVCLNWETRFKIISGIAKGLLYLHEDSRLRIIHRDLKAGNILLDEEMCPKIADFGMAKLFIPNQTYGDTTRIVGTYGYMAPEYAMHGNFSVKSDVYSFGIMLLEIITGQKNSHFRAENGPQELSSYVWENWKAGTASNLIDPMIHNSYVNDIMRSIHIGLLCVQDSVFARPSMASVVLMLNSATAALPFPSKPAFLSCVKFERAITSSSRGKVSTQSVNEISISDLLPR